jgi:hypothetical protein
MSQSPKPTDAQSVTPALTSDQQEWVRHSEALWRRAHAIAQAHPEHDPSDLYHALRCLERSPAERLRAGLQRGRLRTYAR